MSDFIRFSVLRSPFSVLRSRFSEGAGRTADNGKRTTDNGQRTTENCITRIYTIGHSTRSLDELIGLLREHGVRRLADIRRYPGSRRYPHFSKESLTKILPDNGIQYVHVVELGGRREPVPDSPNTAWRNAQFRGYADHMNTREFSEALDRLLASDSPTAIMCAEAVPWRCHRNLVADELTRRGHEVIHILGPGASQKHVMNPIARVVDDHLEYR